MAPQEHEKLMDQFEDKYKNRCCKNRESEPGNWECGFVYKDSYTNDLFTAYRDGYVNAQQKQA